MTFAKLYTTPHGQALFTTVDGDDCYELYARYNIASPMKGAECVVSKCGNFPFTEEGEKERDEAFAEIDEAFAVGLADEGF